MATSMSNRAPARTQLALRPLRESKHVREDRLRRRAGTAWARIQAEGNALAGALHVHKSTITHRKSGQGWLGNGLVDIAALEADGHDTLPMIEVMIETRLEARSRKVAASLEQLSEEETALDGAEDLAQIHFHRTGCARRWRRAQLARVTFALSSLLPAMMKEGR